MKFKELKKKKESELHGLLGDLRDKLRDLRFKDANKQLKNVREIRRLKGQVSRILTLLNNKNYLIKEDKEEVDSSKGKSKN